MDIYSFIRSNTVAEHCRSIGKTWNTLEMAVIIDRSDRSIADKHAAWQKLIDHYPDMPAMPNYHKVQFDSTHEVIAKRIEYERQAVKWFKTPEEGATYTYGPHTWGTRQFTTFEKALANLNEQWLKDKELDAYFVERVATELLAGRSQIGMPYVRFEKTMPDTDGYELGGCSDGNGDLYDVWICANDEDKAKWLPNVTRSGELSADNFNFIDNFFIDIPTPFKVGDLLCYTNGDTQEIFILDWFMQDDKRYEKCLRGEYGDGTDMMGNGLLVNDAGHLYWDHVGDYDSYEYYTDELKGKDVLLYYVNLYKAGKIGLVQILNMQCRNIMEVPVNSNFGLSDHDCYMPPWLRYENRNTAVTAAET